MKKGIIYKIITKHNGLIYIGQTVQKPRCRWRGHLSHLKCQTHNNVLLQRNYDKYGEDDFVFEVIETCEMEKLDEREQYWINFYDSTNHTKGYNFESGGNKNKKASPETIKKLILSTRGHNNKLTSEQVTEIKKKIIEGLTLTEIAEMFKVTQCCIYRIKILQNWAYVSPELNEQVKNTDTSRKIKLLNSDEISECKKLILNGTPIATVARQYKIPYRRFHDIFQSEIETVKLQTQDKKSLVISLFFKNVPLEKILEQAKVSYVQYKNFTHGLEKIRREKNIKYVGESRLAGKTTFELAKELNLNRCTITVYWKEYKKIC